MKILNYDHPDAIDTKLLVKHLKELIAGEKVEMPIYDFATHTRKKESFIVKVVSSVWYQFTYKIYNISS